MPESFPSPITRQVALTAAFQTLYTVSSARALRIGVMHLANVSGAAVTASVCAVAKAGSPAAGNALLWNFSVPANDFIEFGEGLLLPAESSLRAMATAPGAMNLFLSGIEDYDLWNR